MAQSNISTAFVATVYVDLGAYSNRVYDNGDSEILDEADIACWKSALTLLNERSFEHKGRRLKLEVNWSPIIRRLQKAHLISFAIKEAAASDTASSISFPQSSVRVKFNVTTYSVDEGTQSNSYNHFIEYFLYDFFLIMNIAVPSSCNFYNAKITSYPKWLNEKLNLGSLNFENALLESRKQGWPLIGFLPLKQVVDWFSSVRAELKLVPTNRMERVLFAVLHIEKNELSPASVVWIFYALETLFDTKAGENFNALISRIQLLLSPPTNKLSLLKKNMRKLYDLRSAFVHGGLEIIHPAHNELLDRAVEDVFYRLMDAVDFGFMILLASIQETIRQGWREPEFAEVLRGSPKISD